MMMTYSSSGLSREDGSGTCEIPAIYERSALCFRLIYRDDNLLFQQDFAFVQKTPALLLLS